MKEQFPECSKNSIERKLKEYFVKDQRGDDPKPRYYANEDILKQLESEFPGGLINPELSDLAKKRVQPLIDEIAQAKLEADEARREELAIKEMERQELLKMRQEEQDQRDYKKFLEKQEKDKIKAQQKQQLEEEKQQKQQEKKRAKEQKLQEKEQEKEQKKQARVMKREEKEKQKT